MVTGTATDISPHVLVLVNEHGERRFTLAASTLAWQGGLVPPTTVGIAGRVVVRVPPGRHDVADKIWAGIGRVTGTIVERAADSLLVSEGVTKPPRAVVITPAASARIQVRFPQLEAGHLIDVIGLRRGPVLHALRPATSQPAYRAGQMARLPPVTGLADGTLSGSATWHEPAGLEPADGVSYPAIDPSCGCAEAAATAGRGCASMPYLAAGSMLLVRNECTGQSRTLPVTGCSTAASLFCDRCLTCGTSPRSRVADLTLASFVSLGGEPEQGCFNATIAVGS